MTPAAPQSEAPRISLDSVRSLRAVTVTSAPAPIFGQLRKPPTLPRTARLISAKPRPLDFTDIDWALVYRIRHTVSERLSDETSQQLADGQIDEATRIQIGRDLIAHTVKQHSDDAVLAGDRDNQIAPVDLERYTRAVDSSIFGYGRWQPLLEDPQVENIEIRGYDQVFMVYADKIVQMAPVADSDAELIEQLQFISAYSKTPKPFSPAHPEMTLNLEDRFRLHAKAFEVTDRPSIVIRQHTFAGIPLSDLCQLGMLPVKVTEFLSIAVRAKQSIVISGIQGGGKALALDTVVPTPNGPTTMGALRPGDMVFDETGAPCTVLVAHPISYGRPCFAVTFDDGSRITADGDHLWKVDIRGPREHSQSRAVSARVISPEEREWLCRLADEAAEEVDRDVTLSDLVAEVGQQNRPILEQEAQILGPTGHVRRVWVSGKGAHTSAEIRTYSRQLLLKALALRRMAPDTVTPRSARRILTTREMYEASLWISEGKPWQAHRFAIRLAAPLQYPAQKHYVDPWVLGTWLGDGAATTARITTADAEILDGLASAGYPARKVGRTKYDYQIGGALQTQLRTLGVLGAKHIPPQYLYADIAARTALLQGLMDTDGTCNKQGHCQFDTTSDILADQVFQLVVGLGYKPHRTSRSVSFQGRPCGISHRINWTTRHPMFRLPRKLERQGANSGGPTRRYIVAIEPVESVPVRCITVDSPSSLFLVGNAAIPTHNTTFLRALAMELDPLEAVGVIETDPELFLHKLPGRGRTVNFVARSATGEGVGPDGKPIGEYTVQMHLISSLRQNLSRIIVGEVRGDEAATMFEAMQAGAGSLSTIHAQHANATIERLVTAAARGGIMSQVDAYRQIAVNINLIVHLGAEDLRPQGGDFRRFVNQIIEISGFRDTADGTGTTYMPATDVLYDVRNPERPLDEKMSDPMRQALYAQGWQP